MKRRKLTPISTLEKKLDRVKRVPVFVKCGLCTVTIRVRPSALRPKNFCCVDHRIAYSKITAFRLECPECGKTFFTQPAQVKYRSRTTCSLACMGKRAERLAAERRAINPPTQGLLNRRIRYSAAMDRWRKAVFERDNWTCQACNVRGGTLNADHIKPFYLFPELRFSLDNGRTLCVACHRKTATWGRPKKVAEVAPCPA